MPTSIKATIEELKLAYSRTKLDRPSRCFIEYPFLFKLADIELDEWIEALRTKLAEGYTPKISRLCWIPKPNYQLRPGNILNLKDELVYNLIIGKLYDKIWAALEPYQGNPDVAYPLSAPDSKEKWIKSNFKTWDKFRELSFEIMESEIKYVVVSDVTGFYENIDQDKLISDLKQIVGACPEIELLRKCLRKWSIRGDKGIPQGYSASDILAKVFANPIDLALQNDGFTHLRYVDDIRIFCKTHTEARRAIAYLSLNVHQKGLNLQSAKTKILTINQAAFEFDGVTKIIKGIQEEIISQIKEELVGLGPYADEEDFGLLLQAQKELPPEAIEIAFVDNFIEAEPVSFNKTLFHYLLNRLAQAKSKFAVNYCINAIKDKAEETDIILNYFTKVDLETIEINEIVNYISSQKAIYNYQNYLILKWLWDINAVTDNIIKFCRVIAKNHNCEQWLRSYAVAYLGKNGNKKDLEGIELMYSQSESVIGKADCIIGMHKVETGKRNAFYAAVQEDDPLIKRAVKHAKTL